MTLEDALSKEQLMDSARSDATVTDSRLYRADLLEYLLAQSSEAQLTDPDKAACLANLVISVAERLCDDPDTSHSALVRARCLSANARRLAGLFDLAEQDLSLTAPLLEPMPRYDEEHRAIYCRTLALVRWDQGRLDEALSLLRRAQRLFEELRAIDEWKTCSLLLTLLFDEMGHLEAITASLGSFVDTRFEPKSRPWLTSRAMLTFAAAAAAESHLIAQVALDQGIRFQGYVTDPDEQLRLFAMEGRARARLGFFDEALQMIEAVRRQYLDSGRMIDLTLSSLDLLALRVAASQAPGIDELLSDIQRLSYDPRTSLDLASAALDRFVSWVSGDEDPWTSQRASATWYLQAHRFGGLPISPLPFA